MPTTIQTQVLTLPATGAPRQASGIVDTGRIAALLAQRFRLLRERPAARVVPSADGQACELGVRPAAHPVLRAGSDSRVQVGASGVDLVQRRAGGAALVPPQGLFAGHLHAGVAGEQGKALAEQ